MSKGAGGVREHKPDWQAIERAYVEGPDDVTYASLAKANGVAESTVRTRGSKGSWSEARRQFRNEAGTLARQKSLEERAELLATQSGERQGAMHETAMVLLGRMQESASGNAIVSVATAFGIVCDKLHQELSRLAPTGNHLVEESYSRREVILGAIRQGVGPTE